MRQTLRPVVGLLAVGVLAVGGTAALASGGGRGHGRGTVSATTTFTMTPNDGPPEGVAARRFSRTFYVSRVGSGAIFRGTLGSPTVQPFIAGFATPGPNPVATGLKVRGSRLYVAGATTGNVKVYDLRNPSAAPAVFDADGGFINDVDVTARGDVYATDSFKPFVYKITAAQVRAGSGTPQAIRVTPEVQIAPDTANGPTFNLNGIVAGGRRLIVVNSATGKLYRITVRRNGARTIREIAVTGGPLTGGDGLLRERGRLLVVQGQTTAHPTGAVTVVALRGRSTRGTVVKSIGDASFQGPATIARARGRLLVTNPNFDNAATATQFTVSGLDRDVVRTNRGRRGRR